VSGQKPTNSNLQLGELALNTTDGKVYMAKSGSLGPSVEELISTNTVNTGSISITGDISGSIFTGSFKGDGSQLYNIPYSGVTGLELNKIVSGSVSASISPNRGLEINTDTTITGSLTISGSNTLVQVLGDIQTDGFIRFDPVSKNIDASISASYLFVSSSTNDLYFSQNGNGYSNVTRLRWLEGNMYSGLLHGGVITATNGGTTFNVSEGNGIIVSLNASLTDDPYPTTKFVQWDSFTGQTLTYRTTHIQTFIGINDNGEIHQQTGAFNAGQYNSLITLGTVIHQNLSTVNASITYPNVAYGYKQRTYDFFKAFGALKLSGLNMIPTGSLGLNVGSGTAWADGRNYQNDPDNPSYIIDPGTAVSKIFRYYQVSGTTFVQDTNNGAGYTTIDPTKYVLNGTLTSVGGDYTIQRVFWYPNSATKGIVVYYGNDTYGTIREAIDNIQIEQFVEIENTKQNAIYLGSIIIAGNGDFTQSNKFSIVPGGLFRNVGGNGGGGSIPTSRLVDLSDVDVLSAQDNDLLIYNVDTLKWESKKSLEGDYTITGSLNVTGGLTGSIDYSNITNKPTLVSGSPQISYTGITDIPNGIVSGSQQVIDLGFTTTSSFESFTSSYTTDSSSFDSRINTITGSISGLNSFTSSINNFTSSVVLTSQTSSMSVLTSSYALTASFALNAGGGTEGRTARLDQTTASTTWTFNHNLGEQFPAVTIYDFSDNVVIPTTINAQDNNTLIITFSLPQSGTATATVGGGLPFISSSFDGYVLSAVGSAPTWKGGIISSSLQITNFGYATTGSNTFTNNQTINGTLSVRNSLIQQITTTGVTTNTIITSFPTSSYDGGFFDYVIKNGVNLRSGTVTSVWTPNNVEFNEVTTNDLGNTSGVNMLVTLSGGNANLNANVSSGTWTIKVLSRGL
jgi:hypothetical protein